jgi:hypothetical protein
MSNPNERIHKVETQWHYEPMTKAGFIPVTTEVMGLVRSYRYERGSEAIVVTTGVNADYFTDVTSGRNKIGYWNDLGPYLLQTKME